MTRKQVVGLIAAALVFTFVSMMSMFARERLEFTMTDSLFTSSNTSYYNVSNDYVGVVDVSGVIQDSSNSGAFSVNTGYDHKRTLDCIDEMMHDYRNRGVLLSVDSPGGGVYESDEIYIKLMQYRQETGRPVYVYMKTQATSGGYYIAMASDGRVYANRNTWTGSIGVVVSLLNLMELYEKLGIKEISISSGINKSMGSSGLELTREQRDIIQVLVDESYEQFVDIVAQGRDIDTRSVKVLADGRLYSARQALEHNLIDGIMTYEELESLINDELGYYVDIVEATVSRSWYEQIIRNIRGVVPKSDTQAILELIEKKGSGVLMYYANFAQ